MIDVKNNLTYQEKRREVEQLYQTNNAFRESAHLATKGALEHTSVRGGDNSILIAVNYLLDEFAFMEFAPSLLGVQNVTYVYHVLWSVYESYRLGEFDGKVRNYLGSEIVSFK
jgi:tRNA-dependent cyclodipeptide synthase